MENTYDKYKNGISNYDTDHANYRIYEFQKFMRLREKEFINSYCFEGDDNFTRKKQRTFLKMCFRFGYAGVINTTKLTTGQMDDNLKNLVREMGIDLKSIIEKNMGNYIPVAVFASAWDNTEMPIKGVANTSPLHTFNKKVYEVDASNTAILVYDDNNQSGYWWWLLPAYIHAMGKTVMKKRLSLVDGKLANNKINNTYRNVNYDSVYKVDKSFVELAPSQSSMTGDNKANVINISSLLETKLKKLDMSNGEQINDILSFIQDHEKYVFSEMGKRVNLNEGKQERSISMDFESVEVHYRIREKEFEDMMEIFIENYEEVFGKKITLKSTAKETLDDLERREMVKSGRNDKGGQDE